METKKFFRIRFYFFFGAMLVLTLYFAFFTAIGPGSGYNRSITDEYYVGTSRNTPWQEVKMVNSRGDTLLASPTRAIVAVEKGGDVRDEKYATSFHIYRILRIVLLAIITALSLILLAGFFRGIRKNRVFNRFNIAWMRWLALSVLVYWFVTAKVHYLNYLSFQYLLDGADVKLYYSYPIDKFLLLIVSGMMFFLAEIMVVGRKINEENDMTI